MKKNNIFDKFYKDYEKNEEGKYVYVGNLYKLKNSPEEIKVLVRRYWLICLCLFGLEIGAGFLPFKGMIDTSYLILPYCLELISILMILWGCFYLSNSRNGLSESQYRKSIIRIRINAPILMILASLSFALAIIYVSFHGFNDDLIYFILFEIIKIIIFILGLFLNKKTKNLDFEVSGKQTQ